jgi:hypothetical protein
MDAAADDRRGCFSQALAVDDGLDPTEVSRLLPLACLSPEIVEAIIAGNQPQISPLSA